MDTGKSEKLLSVPRNRTGKKTQEWQKPFSVDISQKGKSVVRYIQSGHRMVGYNEQQIVHSGRGRRVSGEPLRGECQRQKCHLYAGV